MRRYWFVLVAMLSVSSVAWGLPDLTPQIYGVSIEGGATPGPGDVAEGCAGGSSDRTLLRFGILFQNIGADALTIGDPGCPVCAENPGALCTDTRFICSPADGHNHPHFLDFANYELLDFRGNLVAMGGKKSFCVRDNRCPVGITPTTTCTNQGLTAGCIDDYDPSLGCQYVDVTDVPLFRRRAFRLRATLDPDELLEDADRRNNVTEVVLPGCGDGVAGGTEQCDPGATPRDPCCNDDCTLQPPGSPCDPPPGPCGTEADPLPDGTPCGEGQPPCFALTCQSGLCAQEKGTGGCLIGGNCFTAGTLDPVNGCQRCDPSSSGTSWSLNLDADPAGLRCQVVRVQAGLVGTSCRPRPTRALATALNRVTLLLDRRAAAAEPLASRLDRRLARQLGRLQHVRRLAIRTGCQADRAFAELDRLVRQFDAFKKAVRGSEARR